MSRPAFSMRNPQIFLKVTHSFLALQRFYDAWSQYNEDQVAYRQKRKDQMLKKIKVAGTDLSDDQIEQMIDEGKTEVFAKSILDQTQMARQQLTELQGRLSQSNFVVHTDIQGVISGIYTGN